jgi:transcriptional regulator with XRE-family HTH domain
VEDSRSLPSIDLELPLKLQDPEYRERFFLAEASAEIARQLIALRKRRGLSQTELAALANTHQPAVSRAEQADYHNWSTSALRKLTNAMGGRMRVIIEAWEDVITEYYPEGYSSEADASKEPKEKASANPSPLRGAETKAPESAATAGSPQRGVQAAAIEAAHFNRQSGGLSALLLSAGTPLPAREYTQGLR